MLKYIFKRILIFIPTLIAISLIAFWISINAPGDPVERLITAADQGGGAKEGKGDKDKQRMEIRERLGLNKPVFYLALGSAAETDTLYKIPSKEEQSNLATLIQTFGNWNEISTYYHSLKKAVKTSDQTLAFINAKVMGLDTLPVRDSIQITQLEAEKAKVTDLGFLLRTLLETSSKKELDAKVDTLLKQQLTSIAGKDSIFTALKTDGQSVISNKTQMLAQATPYKTYIPKVLVYGLNNQYHQWLFGNCTIEDCDGSNNCKSKTATKEQPCDTKCGGSHISCGYSHGVLRLDWGISYRDQKKINTRIGEKIKVSFILSFGSILLAYLISIPLGIYAAYRRNSTFDRLSSVALFVLYSLPSFFVGIILLTLLANPDNLNWFPSAGILNEGVYQESWGFWQKLQHKAPFFILPLITYTYSSFAFLSRQMRVGMIEVMGQDYIRTARAKGLDEKTVVLKHALRNGLLPIITIFASVFPAIIGGSVIVETIYSIPGIGLEIYESVLNADYPMIVSVFTISGFLTLVGYLVSDILYAVVDPRISYK